MVRTAEAVGTGVRKLAVVTSVPSRIREVIAAAAARLAYASSQGV